MLKLFHILTTNKIKYAINDGINFKYYKTPIFLELMLESFFFPLKGCNNKDNHFIFVIVRLHSKSLKGNMGNMDLMEKKTLFDVLKNNWHSK